MYSLNANFVIFLFCAEMFTPANANMVAAATRMVWIEFLTEVLVLNNKKLR